MKVLFVVPYPIEAASTRYRVDQYLPYLMAHGIVPTVSRFIASGDFFDVLYQPGHMARKGAYYFRRTVRRLLDLGRLHRYDAVMIQREALPIGPALFERLTAALGCPILYDFDDAIYLHHASDANRRVSWLKRPDKTADIIGMSSHVTVGNEELASYARRYNPNVTVIPSSIDMDLYRPRPIDAGNNDDPIVIGWVGSQSTAQYLTPLTDLLRELEHSRNVRFRAVGARPEMPGVDVDFVPWKLENEVSDLHGFDIGIMPLPDTPWTRGKGGFKAIQYMGVAIPAVASPVGINCEIIRHGVNGFLPATMEAWRETLVALIDDAGLRQRLGQAGRQTVAQRYSIQANAPKLLDVLRSLTAQSHKTSSRQSRDKEQT